MKDQQLISNPFETPQELPDADEPKPTFGSARRAFLIGCRNGFFWSVLVGLPIAWIVVPAIPRRRAFDGEGNFVPMIEEFGWLGLIERAAPAFICISAIWTVSAGISSLIDHARQHQSNARKQTPTKE